MAKKIRLNLKGYDEEGPSFGTGGGGFFIPEGVYAMRSDSCEQKRSKSSDNEMLEFIFTGTAGKAKGKKFYLYAVISDVQKCGNIMKALGLDPNDEQLEFLPSDVEEVDCFGIVRTDVYNGEKRSKVEMVYPDEDEAQKKFDEAGSDEEEEPAPRRTASARNGGKKKVVKLSEDEVKEMDEEELEDLNNKHDLEVDLSKFKTLTRKKNALIEALGEKDLLA